MRHTVRDTVAAGLLVLPLLAGSALGQVDLAGEWSNRYSEDAPHRGAGPELGDYTGLPINEAARRKAQSWDASILSLRERQCIPHVVTYALRGPTSLRIWTQADTASGELIAYRFQGSYGRPRTIWMDGRSHPSRHAPHTWAGFSTGEWDGNVLIVTTTHIKAGWIQRNGVPTSDRATMTEQFIRRDNLLLIVSTIHDPIYLDEPFIRTTNLVHNPTGRASAFGVCGPAADEVAPQGRGYVPHYLPEPFGTFDAVAEFAAAYELPEGAAGGGAPTTYPEYRLVLAGEAVTPRDAGRRGSGRDDGVSAAAGGGADAAATRTAAPATAARDTTARDTTARDTAARDTAARDTAAPAAPAIEVLHVQGNVYLLAGAGGNIAVQVGDDGVVLVDAGREDASDDVLAAVREISDAPIRIIVNSHIHADHAGGNEALAAAGERLASNVFTGNFDGSGGEGAQITAREEVHLGMVEADAPIRAWPTDSYFTPVRELFVNGEAVRVLHRPAAHTNGDSIVFFRRSDVIATGDVFSTTGYPVIDTERGGSFTGVLDALNAIIDLAIPRDWQEGGTMVIPGHGRLADEIDVVEYRDMMTIVRDRIRAMIGAGMTLEQVKAARPTLEYDGRYGAGSDGWSTDDFVEAAYRSLSEE